MISFLNVYVSLFVCIQTLLALGAFGSIVTLPGHSHFPLGSYLQRSYDVGCLEFCVDIHLLYCKMEV